MSSLDKEIKRKKRRKRRSTSNREESFDYTSLKPKEYLNIGVLDDDSSFMRKAGQRIDLSYVMIPKLAKFIKLGFVIIIICMLISIYAVYKKPTAMLLYSFPNGEVKCPLKSIDLRNGNIIPRTPEEQQLCNMLDVTNNKGYVSAHNAIDPSSLDNNKEKSGGRN